MVLKAVKWLNRKLSNIYYAYGLVAFFALIAYCNSFTVPFLLDDFGSITNNYAIQKFFDIAALWKFYANRIVLYFTFSINYLIHDNGVEGYHITNLLIHIFNGILFYLILKRLFSLPYFKGKLLVRYSNVISVFAAILFVVHPIQVNAVTYIVQRTASLASTFYLLAILCFLNYRMRDKWLQLLLTFIFTVIAMFTKENTITIPFTLLLLELMFFLKDGKTSPLKRILIFLLLFATIPIIPGTNLLLKGYSQSDPDVTFKASTSMDRFHYFYTQLNVILLYIRLCFMPLGQNFDYSNDFPMSLTIWDNYSYIAFFILVLIGLYSIYAMKRNRLVSLGIMWFFIGLSVESSFISIKDVYFEHRLYFPCAGFIIFLIGMIFYERKGKNKQRYILRNPIITFVLLSILLIPLYTGLTLHRNYIYSDSIRLWADTVCKAPDSDRAHNSLATGYLNDYDEGKKNTEYLDLAELEFKKAIDMNSKNSTAHTNLSKVYLLKEDYQKCITQARHALALTDSEYAQYNMGCAYKKLGKTKEALKAFHDGYKFNNRSGFIVEALGETYHEMSDYKNAKKYYEEYLEINKRFDNKEVEEKLEEVNRMLSK
jgi:tetratricopeptide (TPR) repeat protein